MVLIWRSSRITEKFFQRVSCFCEVPYGTSEHTFHIFIHISLVVIVKQRSYHKGSFIIHILEWFDDTYFRGNADSNPLSMLTTTWILHLTIHSLDRVEDIITQRSIFIRHFLLHLYTKYKISRIRVGIAYIVDYLKLNVLVDSSALLMSN